VNAQLSAAERQAVPVLDGRPAEIVPGVYTLGELSPVTVYLVRAGEELVLIDTGYSKHLDQLARSVASLGLDPKRIAHILVTHRHLDHWMNMDWIRSMTGARTYMGRPDAEDVERGLTHDEAVPARLPPRDLVIPPTRVDYKIENEENLPIPGVDILAVPCPGHTPGSICYFLQTGPWGVLFGGDAVMSVRSGLGTYTTRLHPRFGGDIPAYRASLKRLRELEVNLLLPGHPYFDRERTGGHPHPVLTREEWLAVVDGGLEDLERIDQRQKEDGRDFLDGAPKEIAHGLVYLGGEHEAAYALVREDEVCLVDPHRLPPEALESAFESLGLEAARVASVLLTSLEPERAGRLRAMLEGERVAIFGNSTAKTRLGSPEVVDFTVVDRPVQIEACGLSVEATPTIGWDRASVVFFVDVDGKRAALTGDAVLPLTADHRVVPLEASAVAGPSPDASDSLEPFERRKVAIWLPGHPFAAQNANLYDDEWLRLVRGNRLTLAGIRPPAR
jgi:glyoxylase-like metal-dependent hydrolase (beta-lactamase superfamily II)